MADNQKGLEQRQREPDGVRVNLIITVVAHHRIDKAMNSRPL